MPNFGRYSVRGSKYVSNIMLQKKESAIYEFQNGIIGPKVWQYLFSKAGISIPVGWFSTIPSTESLERIERSEGEMVIICINKIERIKVNGFFWGNLGVSFNFKQNFSTSTNGLSVNVNQYLQRGFGVENGVYVGNPSGIFLGNVEAQKESLDHDSIPLVGLQIVPEVVHYVLFGKFLNPNHFVRCHCFFKNNVFVGGGDKAIRIVDSGIHPTRIALGSMRRVYV